MRSDLSLSRSCVASCEADFSSCRSPEFALTRAWAGEQVGAQAQRIETRWSLKLIAVGRCAIIKMATNTTRATPLMVPRSQASQDSMRARLPVGSKKIGLCFMVLRRLVVQVFERKLSPAQLTGGVRRQSRLREVLEHGGASDHIANCGSLLIGLPPCASDARPSARFVLINWDI